MLAARPRPQFQMQSVVDLRSGLPAALWLISDDAGADLLRDAFGMADAARVTGPIQLSVHARVDEGEALALAATLESIARPPRSVDVVLDEGALAALGYGAALSVAQIYRACGFGVALHAADAPVIAFGAHARAAFTDLRLTPHQAHQQANRLNAASEAGLTITASAPEAHTTKALLAMGFDRVIQS